MEKKKAKSATKTKKTTTVAAKKVTKNVTKKVAPKKEVEKEIVVPKVTEVKKVETKKTSDHSLFKAVSVVILVVALLTWFIKGGSWTYQDETGAAVVNYVANETATTTGINELFLSAYYGINYYLIQITFLAMVGVFYGVVSKTKGYKLMVKKAANLLKGKKVVFTLVSSFVIALFASVTTQPIVTVLFIPVLFSIAKELKINKVSAFLATFGALAIGLMGLTYGTYGLNYAAQNMGVEVTSGILYRVIILLVGYLFLNLFIVLFNKKNNNLEIAEDHFELTEESERGGHALPYVIMFVVLFIIAVLGYVGYSSVLGIETFNELHTWLTTELFASEGKTSIVAQILGNVTAFGTWDPFTMMAIMAITLIIVKFAARISIDELLDNALAGLQKMAKPIVLVVLAYSVFVLSYWSGITNAIVNFFNAGEGFNFGLVTLGNAIADFLHIDVEYTGFAFGAFYAAKYAEHTDIILAILSATSGFVTLFVPTSIFMLTGLSLSNISYKEYLKSTWKFLVGLAVVLCVILAVITLI